ncbi:MULTISPECIES: MFS transporter [Streptomyces]|uniref:MFS transporter n=1 Tax=Streptomyces TaxID=1883 RepID=UPI00358FAD15
MLRAPPDGSGDYWCWASAVDRNRAGDIIKASFQQRHCPPDRLGRLTAGTAFRSHGTIPIGALLGGTLGTALGLHTAMAITTAGIPLAALTLLFSRIR